mgnify:CR=1 FL=1
MFLVVAVFNKENLQNVVEDLRKNHIEGITIVDVYGMGNIGFSEHGQKADFYPKVKVEIVVSNAKIRETAMECIRSNCQDLGHGAGKIWWLNVGGVERVRTGEKDEDALTTQIDKKIKNVMDDSCFHMTDTPCS